MDVMDGPILYGSQIYLPTSAKWNLGSMSSIKQWFPAINHQSPALADFYTKLCDCEV